MKRALRALPFLAIAALAAVLVIAERKDRAELETAIYWKVNECSDSCSIMVTRMRAGKVDRQWKVYSDRMLKTYSDTIPGHAQEGSSHDR